MKLNTSSLNGLQQNSKNRLKLNNSTNSISFTGINTSKIAKALVSRADDVFEKASVEAKESFNSTVKKEENIFSKVYKSVKKMFSSRADEEFKPLEKKHLKTLQINRRNKQKESGELILGFF